MNVRNARSAPLGSSKILGTNFILYTRTPATPGPAHAHQFSSVQFSSVQFSSVQFSSVQFSSGQLPKWRPTVTAEVARLPLLGGAPPVDLLRLDARRKIRRKRPDALADQTRAVAGDPV